MTRPLSQDVAFTQTMRRALTLAIRGLGFVEPNPPVGAVIVDDSGTIISEGWHPRFGGPHAEVVALAAAGERARGATLFCTLEPCSHHGKTPPCAPAVIAAGIRNVYIATGDPAPHVNGRGIAQLRAAGLEVQVGFCEDEARRLIAPFRRLMLDGRPWVHAKWAMSLDGRMATRTGDSQWISGPESRAIAHQLRGRCDAILVGIGTVLADDPMLTARPAGPRIATRIILDTHARTPLTSQLVQTARDIPTLIAVGPLASPAAIQPLAAAGVEVLSLPLDQAVGQVSLPALMEELGRRRMTHVLIEGGAGVLGAAFDADLVDECHAYIAPRIIGGQGALSPIGGIGPAKMVDVRSLTHMRWEPLGADLYLQGDVTRSEERH